TIGGGLLQQNLLEAAGLLALRDRLLVDQVVLLIATMTIRREQNAERWLAIPQNLRRRLARLRRRGLGCAHCAPARPMARLGVSGQTARTARISPCPPRTPLRLPSSFAPRVASASAARGNIWAAAGRS